MRYLNCLLSSLILATACNGGSGTTDAPTTDPTTETDTTGGTTADPITDSGDTSSTGDSEGDSESTVGPVTSSTGDTSSTGQITTGEITTGEITTGDITTGDTEVLETGVVDGDPTVIENACAPDDGPALAFKIGVTPFDCSGDFPEDGEFFRVVLFQDGPLAPGVYPIDGGEGIAFFDDGNGELISQTGTVSVIEWNDGSPYGEVDITFPDNTHIVRAFQAIACDNDPPCK